MKREDTWDGVTWHWFVCDNCGDFTEPYEDEDELCRKAAEEGWHKNVMLGKVFCGMECHKEYLTREGGSR